MFKVQDGCSESAPAVVDVTVVDGTPPEASFTYLVDDLTVNVDASGSSDAEDAPADLQVRWDWDGDGVWDTAFSGTKANSCAYATGGSRILVVQVKDTDGMTDTASAIVDTVPPPPPGSLVWAIRGGGTGSDRGKDIAVLPDGTTVVTGCVSDGAVLGEGGANETLLVSAGSTDIFLARYDSDGGLEWAKRAGGIDGDCGTGVAVLADGSALVVGYFQGTAVFGQGEVNATSLVSEGYEDLFIAKYGPNGLLSWARQAGGPEPDRVVNVAVLADGTSVATGSFVYTATFGQGEPNETTLTTSPFTFSSFVARYEPDGTLAWANIVGYEASQAHGVAVLPDGTAFVTGESRDGVVFGLGDPNETTLATGRNANMFLARYNPDGTLVWVASARSPGYSFRGRSVAVLTDGSALVAGEFCCDVYETTVTFGSGEPNETTLTTAGGDDAFLARYNPDGTLCWAKGVATGRFDGSDGKGVAVASDGTAYMVGYFTYKATFGSGEANETSLYNYRSSADVFVASYSPAGTLAWAKNAGANNTSDYAAAVCLQSDTYVFVTGDIGTATAYFGPFEANQTGLTSAGSYDIFVAKYNP